MLMSAANIIDTVDEAIHDVIGEFEVSWTRFYREQDIGSRLYELIQQKLGHPIAVDRSGKEHYLVHHEWPTPFKCDMKKGQFEIMPDDSGHHRGHYDMVVLNPVFVRNHTLDEVRSLQFQEIRHLLNENYRGPVAVLYGIELMFRRDKRNGVDSAWFGGIEQDYKKLRASTERSNLMHKALTLAFDAYPNCQSADEFSRRYGHCSDIRYVIPSDHEIMVEELT